MSVERLRPKGMHENPAYSQGVVLPLTGRHVLVGGQNGVDAEGKIIGRGDLAAQTAQALANLSTVLEAGGATPADLVSLSIYIVGDADLRPAFGSWMAFWGDRGAPPVLKVLRVTGLANSDFLIEIEGLAAVVQEARMG